MSRISFDIITLFPSFFSSPLDTSLTKKATEKNLLEVNTHDLRGFGVGKHKQVDDTPFGGGPGMVLRVDVLSNALSKTKSRSRERPHTILLDPSGKKFNQQKALSLSKKKRIILVCGHYEGVDERFKNLVDEEISIGDYVLTGGEPAALVLIDSVSRLIPGFLGSKDSARFESFSEQEVGGKRKMVLDYPVYTRPKTFKKMEVPSVLLSGDHNKIKDWRREKSIEKTSQNRPDLFVSPV